MSLRLSVLGAAAGGGVPQWNCGCANCTAARDGAIPPMTQSSLAASADGERWVVFNASPDVRAQLAASPALAPPGLRGTPIQAVVLTNGDVDHVAGLLTLREKTGFALYATPGILETLAANPIFGVLDPAVVARRPMTLGSRLEVAGLTLDIFPVPGKVPLYQEEGEVVTDVIGETTIGVAIAAHGRTALYVPGCAAIPDDLLARMAAADLVLFDGTVWQNDEMPRLGTGAKTGLRMGHLPISGETGSLARMAAVAARKVYVHINNTNPILAPDSPERREVEAAGWLVGADGMEFAL